MTDHVTCAICARPRSAATPTERLAWVTDRTERGVHWLCPTCARAHVRDIEGKLPAEYW